MTFKRALWINLDIAPFVIALFVIPTPLFSLSFYCFYPIDDPTQAAADHCLFLDKLLAKGRVYISFQGINAQLTLPERKVALYTHFLQCRMPLDRQLCHLSPIENHAFSQLKVKVKQQLIAYPDAIDLHSRAFSVDAHIWKEMVRSQEKSILLDVRNQIEWNLGHFEGAIASELSSFRYFSQLIKRISNSYDPSTQIMMYCTGGIRCEFFSALLIKRGFKNLYQLRGGILNYAQNAGSDHWLGRLFVFDERLAIDVKGICKEIASCIQCGNGLAHPFNCANVDCNALFLVCENCYIAQRGCCEANCARAARVRKISSDKKPRIFGKLVKENLIALGKREQGQSSL